MAHELEQREGRAASLAIVVTEESHRQEPWHRLGTYVAEAMNPLEALRLAGLDRRAVLEPLTTASGLSVPNRAGVVLVDEETGEREVVGDVGHGWRPVQPLDALSFMYDVMNLDKQQGFIETAGMLRPSDWSGRGEPGLGCQMFATLRHEDLVLDPKGRADVLRPYLFMGNGFDGKGAFFLKRTGVRVLCRNTQEMALRSGGAYWKVNHTKGVEGRVTEAGRALGLVSAYDAAMVAEIEAMLQAEITPGTFDKYVRGLFPEPSVDAPVIAHERWEERMGTLHSLYRTADTNANITGTPWGAYQAVTEFVDWYRPSLSRDLVSNAGRTITSSTVVGLKERAYREARALVPALA